MTAPCFVDADILVYARDPRDPLKQQRAAEWLDWLWQQRAGRTSMQVLTEFYAAVTTRLEPPVPADVAWHEVSRYFAWGPQPVDDVLLWRARELAQREGLAWWDSMVVAAAQIQDCSILASENLRDGAVFGTVTVRNPFTSVLEEPAARYVLVLPDYAKSRQAHRRAATGRGR